MLAVRYRFASINIKVTPWGCDVLDKTTRSQMNCMQRCSGLCCWFYIRWTPTCFQATSKYVRCSVHLWSLWFVCWVGRALSTWICVTGIDHICYMLVCCATSIDACCLRRRVCYKLIVSPNDQTCFRIVDMQHTEHLNIIFYNVKWNVSCWTHNVWSCILCLTTSPLSQVVRFYDNAVEGQATPPWAHCIFTLRT